jgi:hypothetical protein
VVIAAGTTVAVRLDRGLSLEVVQRR